MVLFFGQGSRFEKGQNLKTSTHPPASVPFLFFSFNRKRAGPPELANLQNPLLFFYQGKAIPKVRNNPSFCATIFNFCQTVEKETSAEKEREKRERGGGGERERGREGERQKIERKQ